MTFEQTVIPKRGTAWAPGACGELVEGLIGDQAFLVSCPINLYSKAKVCLYPSGHGQGTQFQNSDTRWPKARQAIAAALEAWEEDAWAVDLEIESSIPLGKGMGSSTADIGAALAATALALGRVPDPVEITQFAVRTEPTDSTIFPELTIVDHIQGSILSGIGKPPPLQVMVFDWGGEISSDNWYQDNSPFLPIVREQGPLIARALEMIRQGVRWGDGNMIAQGATLSALLHQAILHKQELGSVARYAREQGAYGVTIAHSGTVAGMIFPPMTQTCIEKVADAISREFSMVQYLGTYELIAGGIRW